MTKFETDIKGDGKQSSRVNRLRREMQAEDFQSARSRERAPCLYEDRSPLQTLGANFVKLCPRQCGARGGSK